MITKTGEKIDQQNKRESLETNQENVVNLYSTKKKKKPKKPVHFPLGKYILNEIYWGDIGHKII